MCVCVEGEGKRWASFFIMEGEVDGLYYFFIFYRAKKIAAPLFICENWEEKTSFFCSHDTIATAQLFLCGGDGG